MREVLEIIGIILVAFVVIFGFAFGLAYGCRYLMTIPKADGFNKLYNTEYSTLDFMFNEDTYRQYHGYGIVIKE